MSATNVTVRVLRLVDHDAQFALNQDKAGSNPVILNLEDLSHPDYIERLNDLISSDGAGADYVAKCQCNNLEGNNRLGMRCPICHTEVEVTTLLDEDHLICRNWLSCPKELPNGWLAPKIYLNLAEWLTYDKRRRNYLDDILDVETPIPFELSDVVTGKGFNYLYDNFDRLMDYFINNHPIISKKPDTAAMKLWLELYRNQIFCHYVPILNSALSPYDKESAGASHKKRYTDTTADNIRRAAISLSRLHYSTKRKNRLYMAEQTAYKAFKDIVAYVEESTKKYISHKKAIPRTHIFGSRFHLSFRAVVTPIVKPHLPDHLHVPMKLAVSTFRVHIYNKLFHNLKLDINTAVEKINRAMQIVDPDIVKILNELIEESPFPGIPCLWDRPPSIRDGSVMLKYITEIKEDINDSTISITPIDVALPNADFDGDNLAGIVLMETEAVRALRNVSPDHLIFNRNNGEVTNEIGINKSLAITWNNFLQVV